MLFHAILFSPKDVRALIVTAVLDSLLLNVLILFFEVGNRLIISERERDASNKLNWLTELFV